MTIQPKPRLVAALRSVSFIAGPLVMLLAALVLLGWGLDVAPMKSVLPGLVPVNPTSAAALVLAGASLWLSLVELKAPNHTLLVRRIALGAAAVVALLGLLTLIEYVFGRAPRVDQLLFPGKLAGIRIAPTTGLNLLLVGAALSYLNVETRGGHQIAQYVVLPAAVATLMILTGSAYDAHSLYGAAFYIPMPFGAAVAFAVLCVGILCAHPDRGLMQVITSESPFGLAARRLLLVTTSILFLLGIVAVEGHDVGVFDAAFGFSFLVTVGIVILVALIWWSARWLHHLDFAHKQAEEALQESNTQLTSWVGELEQRNSEIKQLSEVGNLLQNCVTPDEAYTVITQAAHQLFPSRSGALYVISPPGNLLDTVAVWGESGPLGVFTPEECWALRRGRPHLVDDSRGGLVCPHLSDAPPASYACIPMMEQGEPLGVFHVQTGPLGGVGRETALPHLMESEQHLTVAVADEIALALANLKLREILRAQSIRDPLTGVFNRRYMEESLERELRRATRKEYPVGIIMLDIDHFQRFNDTYGREAGDALLRALGEFLGTHIRKEDIACRHGGEEFVLIMPEAPLEVSVTRAEQLREEFKQLDLHDKGRPLGPVSMSLGVAIFPENGVTAEPLLRAVTEALYQAKAEGRDRVKTAA